MLLYYIRGILPKVLLSFAIEHGRPRPQTRKSTRVCFNSTYNTSIHRRSKTMNRSNRCHFLCLDGCTAAKRTGLTSAAATYGATLNDEELVS